MKVLIEDFNWCNLKIIRVYMLVGILIINCFSFNLQK